MQQVIQTPWFIIVFVFLLLGAVRKRIPTGKQLSPGLFKKL